MQFLKRFFARTFVPAAVAEQAVASLKAVLGTDLVSVVAFGSWAVGEYVEGYSDLNLLVVTRRLDAELIKRLAPVAASIEGPKCRPLYFSLPELKRHAEAFPLKFQDIAETRKLLHGEDPFQRLDINTARLAEDLEHEARRLLIRFRHQWMRHPASDGAEALAGDTISLILPLLRGMLRLSKRKPPRQRVRVIEDACRQFRLGRRTLLQAHDLRYGRKNAERIDAVGLLDRLLVELERLSELCVKFREDEPGASDRGERRERPERHERHERHDRERHDRERSGTRPSLGGDRTKRQADVRQMVADASLKKRWEPKEPDRFASDDMARDLGLSLAARFTWDRAWQPERRAKGYVAVRPPDPEPPVPEDEATPPVALSTDEAVAALWADEIDDEPPQEAAAEGGGDLDADAENGADQGA